MAFDYSVFTLNPNHEISTVTLLAKENKDNNQFFYDLKAEFSPRLKRNLYIQITFGLLSSNIFLKYFINSQKI